MAFKNEKFLKVKYYAFGGTGTGASAADPASPVDSDVMAIEAGMVIEFVNVVVTTAITGTTQLDVGDDDDQNGFVAAATLTAGAVSPANFAAAGAYLAAGLKKFYSAAGKEVKLDITTAMTAGAFAVEVEGYMI